MQNATLTLASATLASAVITAAGMAVAQSTGNATDTEMSTTQDAGAEATSAVSCSASLAITDSDNDGTISRSEFESWNNSGFSRLDADGDGELTRSEFVDCMSDLPGSSDMAGSGLDAGELDANADGSVSADEFMNATNEAQQQAETGQEDGIVLLRRYILVPTNMPDGDLGAMSPADVAASSAQKFRSLDSDTDGRISQDEMQSTDMSGAAKWANTDFDDMDQNSDGMVSMSEYSSYAEEKWRSATNAAGNMQQASDTSGSAQVPMVYYYYFDPEA